MIDMERRDRALDFRWGIPAEFLWAAGIPDTPDRLYDQARRSIYAAACIAADETPGADGWWISYSRRKEFYAGAQRYQGLPFTYERVTAAVAEGVALGLLEEQRATPGAHLAKDPRQSRFRATRDLLSAFQDAPFSYTRRPCHLVVRGDDGRPVTLPRTQALDRMTKQVTRINAYLQGSTSKIREQPAAFRASRCRSKFWSSVETRA